MKIFILSKGRAATIRTHLLLKGLDYKIVLHTNGEKRDYLLNETIPPDNIIVSGVPFGVAAQRQWIQDNLVAPDEWYICLDDNIRAFLGVPKPQYDEVELPVQEQPKHMKVLFEQPISAARFIEICEEMRDLGEKEGAYNLGFATTGNHFFRAKKYRWVGYVISKAVIRKNVGIPFEIAAQSMEDYAYTAENLLRYGKVLINNFVFPMAGHYERGGIGTYAERLPAKIKDSEYLMRKYPDLFRHPNKKTAFAQGELAIRFTSLEQVRLWRRRMYELKGLGIAV